MGIRVDKSGTVIPLRVAQKSGSIGGGFIVLRQSNKVVKGRTYHVVQCTICGHIKEVRTGNITQNYVACTCHSLIRHIRYFADKRGIKFEVEEKQIWDLLRKQNFKCALTNREIYYEHSKDRTASLNRIDSLMPYVLDNIQWVHIDANKMKQDFSQEYLFQLCKDVIKVHEGKING